MKAKNNKEVLHGYLLFAIAILCAIVLGLGCTWLFFITAHREIISMESRSQGYDATFTQQLSLIEKVDSLYNNISLLNSGRRFNELVLQNRISTQKMDIQTSLREIDKNDVALYNRMFERINIVLHTKDSIRAMNNNVEQVKSDLQRCIQDNRTATRKMMFNNTTN